jgi:hypothetical protein
MSYCRWSSDNWMCDIYCYYSTGDKYVTHVAGNRVVGNIPKIPKYSESSKDEWNKAYKAQMDFMDSCEREYIGLPYDGMTFEDDTLIDFLNRLTHLRNTGYNIPDFVFEEIKDELKGSCK